MDFNINAFDLFDRQWALVTAGTKEHFNTMTISWGGLGTLWGKPVATVYVKPIRYTHQFLENSDIFTLSFFEEKYREALALLGSRSGREGDKVAKAGVTPCALEKGITFREAAVTLVCRKIYRQDLDTAAMPRPVVEHYYEEEAPHTMYIGEVLAIVKGDRG